MGSKTKTQPQRRDPQRFPLSNSTLREKPRSGKRRSQTSSPLSMGSDVALLGRLPRKSITAGPFSAGTGGQTYCLLREGTFLMKGVPAGAETERWKWEVSFPEHCGSPSLKPGLSAVGATIRSKGAPHSAFWSTGGAGVRGRCPASDLRASGAPGPAPAPRVSRSLEGLPSLSTVCY